jgi:hypothetical protein
VSWKTKTRTKEGIKMNVQGKEVVAINSSNFPTTALVYGIEHGINEYVIAKIGHTSRGTGYDVNKQTARKYKIYSNKEGRLYFQWQGLKFYMDETIKTAF